MKFLIYGLHFKPDLIGIGKYTGEMADWLNDNNHEVQVITAPHFYPEWKEETKQRLYKKMDEPYPVWRCPIYVPSKPKALNRLLHYISFSVSSLPILMRYVFWKPDYIITIEPPFATSLNTLLLSLITRAKSILHIQDLELDAAYSLEMLNNSFLYNILSKIERMILQRFKNISTISEGMKSKIVEKGIDQHKILLLPNWADIDTIKPGIDNYYLRNKFSIEHSKNIVLYSGNLGEKQNLDSIIFAADIFANTNPNVHFLIIGDGSAKTRLQKEVLNKGLSNVSFFPLQPKEDFGALLTLADIHLITQDQNISDYVLPSKLTNILSAGGTAVISAKRGTQLANLIDKHNIGYLINPNSNYELTRALKFLINNENERRNIGNNARDYAEEHLTKDKILSNFTFQLM